MQASLFSADPEWLVAPETKLERAFALFHRTNPHVYRDLEERALGLATKGVPRIGIAMLFEAMRYSTLETTGRDWKLNNSLRALYARLLLFRNPRLRARIEIRERREVGATA